MNIRSNFLFSVLILFYKIFIFRVDDDDDYMNDIYPSDTLNWMIGFGCLTNSFYFIPHTHTHTQPFHLIPPHSLFRLMNNKSHCDFQMKENRRQRDKLANKDIADGRILYLYPSMQGGEEKEGRR